MPKGETYVALMRGINVGGKNKVSMHDLADLFTQAGCVDARTYIQSGNVVFTCSAGAARGVAESVTARLLDRFGVRSPLILRTGREMADVVAGQPFSKAEHKTLHVAFLQTAPSASAARNLNAEHSPGDALRLSGCEVYLHLPGGVSGSELTNAWLDRALGTVSTMRNWKTVCTLAEMASA